MYYNNVVKDKKLYNYTKNIMYIHNVIEALLGKFNL